MFPFNISPLLYALFLQLSRSKSIRNKSCCSCTYSSLSHTVWHTQTFYLQFLGLFQLSLSHNDKFFALQHIRRLCCLRWRSVTKHYINESSRVDSLLYYCRWKHSFGSCAILKCIPFILSLRFFYDCITRKTTDFLKFKDLKWYKLYTGLNKESKKKKK